MEKYLYFARERKKIVVFKGDCVTNHSFENLEKKLDKLMIRGRIETI